MSGGSLPRDRTAVPGLTHLARWASPTRIAADLERLETDLHAHAGEVTGDLGLVGFSTAMRGLIGPVVAALMENHPGLRVRLRELEPWDAVSQVAAGTADVALVHGGARSSSRSPNTSTGRSCTTTRRR